MGLCQRIERKHCPGGVGKALIASRWLRGRVVWRANSSAGKPQAEPRQYHRSPQRQRRLLAWGSHQVDGPIRPRVTDRGRRHTLGDVGLHRPQHPVEGLEARQFGRFGILVARAEEL